MIPLITQTLVAMGLAPNRFSQNAKVFVVNADGMMDKIVLLRDDLTVVILQFNTSITEINNTVIAINSLVQSALSAGLENAAANASTASTAAATAVTAKDDAVAAWTAALAANPDLNSPIHLNANRIAVDATIPDGYNALTVGPFEVDPAVTVRGLGNSTWRGI